MESNLDGGGGAGEGGAGEGGAGEGGAGEGGAGEGGAGEGGAGGYPFLRKGGGKLASDYHGITKFAIQRKEKIIKEQEEREEREKNYWMKENATIHY